MQIYKKITLIMVPVFILIIVLLFSSFRGIKGEVKDYLSLAQSKSLIDKASVYAKDLKSGKEIKIDSDEKYYAASLFKLPLLLDFYKEAQQYPDLLESTLFYTPEIKEEVDKGPLQYPPIPDPLKVNKDYTIDFLLNKMISESDNTPAEILSAYLPKLAEKVQRTMKELGLNVTLNDGYPFVSPYDYSKIFDALYNKSFLNETYSQKAISLLSNTNYHEALEAGVPQGIIVAHKFGDYSISYLGQEGLNDCGLVMRSDDPYVICVMVIGKDIHQLESVISNVSSLIYNGLR